jgi:CubicO group peptidase (beta-lactamase class C family)
MNWKIKYSILAVAFWLLLFIGWEWWRSYPRVRAVPSSSSESKNPKIDSILIQSVTEFLIPGIAVGIVQDEKIAYLKAFGYSNLATKELMSVDSPLPIASVSKIFTSLDLASLCIERSIPIDTSINVLLPRGKKLPNDFNSITLRDLLTHSSGLGDTRNVRNLFISEEKRSLELLTTGLRSPKPESKEYNYADMNFDLIGYAIEINSKQSFEQHSRRVLSAAGMEKSFFAEQDYPELYQGYKQTFIWKRIQPAKLKYDRYPSPSSGLISTAHDLSRALLHLSRGNMGAYENELKWLQRDTNVPAGFQKIILNDTVFIGHFGEQGGFSSILLYSSDLEIGIVLLSNSADKNDFRKHISEQILHTLTHQAK